jgi:hypothetical protein
MKIDIKKDWDNIKAHFRKCNRANMHIVISSINENHEPTATPIGSLFLNENQTGFYFEKFATQLGKNVKEHPKVCLLAVNNNKWFWLRSLFRGRFSTYPGIKLYGVLGEKRAATPKEFRAFQRRVRSTKKLKGYQYLWKEMSEVRVIKFTKATKINLGKMTHQL